MASILFNRQHRKNNHFSIDWYLGVPLIMLLFLNDFSHAASAREPLVVVSKARTQTVIKQVPLTGTINSAKVSRLSTEVSGQVETINVEVGDSVKTGDVLVQLDAEIETLTLQSSQASTTQARAELADARRRYKDAERLKKQNSISDNAIRLIQAEVEIDAAALKRQQAEERVQQARVDRHTLKAPFTGVISERLTEIGEWIDPGRAILTLVAVDDLRVDFRVPQEFYTRINEKSGITVTLDALPKKEFNGTIETIVPVTDPSARTFLMHVRLGLDDIKITPGMSVHGLLRLNTGMQGVVISRDALLRYPDGRVTVWVVSEKNQQSTVSEQQVKVGHGFNGQVSILDGLQAGDVVVVEGNESLQEGQQVRILDTD